MIMLIIVGIGVYTLIIKHLNHKEKKSNKRKEKYVLKREELLTVKPRNHNTLIIKEIGVDRLQPLIYPY
jgi:hypothetical protein